MRRRRRLTSRSKRPASRHRTSRQMLLSRQLPSKLRKTPKRSRKMQRRRLNHLPRRPRSHRRKSRKRRQKLKTRSRKRLLRPPLRLRIRLLIKLPPQQVLHPTKLPLQLMLRIKLQSSSKRLTRPRRKRMTKRLSRWRANSRRRLRKASALSRKALRTPERVPTIGLLPQMLIRRGKQKLRPIKLSRLPKQLHRRLLMLPLLRKMLPRKKTTQSRLKSRMLSMKARRRMNRKVRVSRPLRSEPKKPRKRLRLLLRPPSRRPS